MENSDDKPTIQSPSATIRVNDKGKMIPFEKNVPIPEIVSDYEINLNAARRQKVREFMNMGYRADEILKILERGVEINGVLTKLTVSLQIIKTDLDFIKSEIASSDVDFSSKRAAIMDKYDYLYKQTIKEYQKSSIADESGQSKAGFLNAARAILDKISELEGLNLGKKGDTNLNILNQQQIVNFANETRNLPIEDRSAIIAAIDSVLAKSKT